MSSVSSVTSSSLSSTYNISGMQRRPSAAKMAEDLFSKLDTTSKGYIEESDLTSALSSLSSSSSSSSTSASDIFNELDSDSDGKITKDELTNGLEKLAESLDNQFNQMRMQAATTGSSQSTSNSDGFTKDELTNQLSEIDSTDSKRSSLINNIIKNFDAADTDSDGKVSFAEAMAYDQNSQSTTGTSSTTASTSTSSTTASTNTTEAQVLRQLMDLLRAYGTDDQSSQGVAASLLSVSA